MRDFYEFDEERYHKRTNLRIYIAVALIFAILGGTIAYALTTAFGNTKTGPLDRYEASNQDNTNTSNDEPVQIGFAGDLLIDEKNPVVDIAKKVEPAVVGITSTIEVIIPDFFFNIQRKQETEGYGSGIVISEEGYILTNNHVVDGAKRLYVVLSSGETVEARLVGADAKTDIAVIKIEHDNLTVAKIGDSTKTQKGEFVVTIGNPLSGHALAGTINFGIISAVNRELKVENKVMKLLQTDAAINRGNSGGALVNMKGEVIGMNTAKIAGESVEGLGFAIPSEVFVPIAQELIKNGKVTREAQPWLGIINPLEIDENISREYGYPIGVLVREVYDGGPADEAGVKPGDVIIGYNNKTIRTLDELKSAIAKNKVGDVVNLKLWRNGDEFVLKVKLGDISVFEQ